MIRTLNTPVIGTRFGRIRTIGTAFLVSRYGYNQHKRTDGFLVCECDCGNIVAHKSGTLNENSVCKPHCKYANRKKPGKTSRPLYNTWNSIIYRCLNPRCPAYGGYGGRGISICDEWRHSFSSFESWAIANGWDSSLQIDRIDNNGDYKPSNCRFVTPQDNSNNRRSNRMITCWGEEKTASQWEEDERVAVTAAQIRYRIGKGWSDERAIKQPVRKSVQR